MRFDGSLEPADEDAEPEPADAFIEAQLRTGVLLSGIEIRTQSPRRGATVDEVPEA
jgi:hypothetical protein